MRILGVDPGTQKMGYGVLETGSGASKCLEWGCLTASRGEEIHVRLLRLYEGLTAVVQKWKPEHLAIEEPFVSMTRGAKSAVAVGQAQALALLLASANGMEVFRYAPAQVKRAIADYGAGDKAQTQRMVQLMLGMPREPISQDASDALAVALCHVAAWNVLQKIRQSELSRSPQMPAGRSDGQR